jgi:hypothetical protein
MKRLLIILLLTVIAVIAATAWLLVQQGSAQHDSKGTGGTPRQESVGRVALKAATEFLLPDTASDIRFGDTNAHSATPSPSPTPHLP